MTYEEALFKALTKVCPGTYRAWRPGKAPPLPWFAYSLMRSDQFHADNTNYFRLPRYRVELLFEESDPKLVADFEQALSGIGTWSRYEAEYLDSEGCFMHDYRLSASPGLLRETESGNG